MLQVEREDAEDIVSNGLWTVCILLFFICYPSSFSDFTEAKEVWHWCWWEQVQFKHGALSAFMSNSNSPVWPPVGLEEPEKNI